ncbi:MAG TPA: HAMP domain-containing sensor histidine kinase [Cytophagaceae bacterium]|jgi:signal transduction histidine kinase|nr:HAMP domain-containing sensor histidine kinase [Cytophagaceae bacterium]
MNLLDKSTRYYLVYSLFVFSLGSLFFYFSIQQVINDGIDEALLQEKIVLIENLRYERAIDSLKLNKDFYIHTIEGQHKAYDHFRTIRPSQDTTLKYKQRQLESVFKHGGEFYILRIRQSLQREEELIDSILPVGIVMFMILLVGVLMINNMISVRVWAPFYLIMDRLKAYDIKTGEVLHYDHVKIKEFDQLTYNLFLMTSKIHEDFRSQKEFNENFSHELQTPLAIIQNNLENMIQSPHLQEEEMNQISGIMEAVKRISSLSKGLLLLSQIDNNQFPEVTDVDIVAVSKKLVHFFSGIIEDKKIVIIEKYSGSVLIKANQALIDILVTNIISNAIRHNIDEGYISIDITMDRMMVSNSGKPLMGDVNTIFDRFVKLGEKKNSIGLGLPIVKKICEVSGFSVAYENNEAEHTITVKF